MEWEVLVRCGMYSKTQCVLPEMWKFLRREKYVSPKI